MTWLRRLSAGDGTSRIVCLPYAGGNGSIYESWTKWLPPEVELWAPYLPAREERMLEAPVEDMELLVGTLLDELGGDERPTSLFGHSFGSLVAYELARRLQKRSLPVRALVASGMPAPQTLPPRSVPTDAEILASLRSHGVAPAEFFQQPELLELVMPGIRADYGMAMGYRYREGEKLSARVFALGGTEDAQVPAEALAAWAELAQGDCPTRMWPGGHMYLLSHVEDVATFVINSHRQSIEG
ncbi:alpha/beta fold hydrolase [Streptomyces sp. Je 1-79]|uniref:thioesterase II family protein n=1 Tax=Streptomyces sp. Je 1-79 TaxID=2943847 RepID=UPI0021A3402B|nr:alpha/beta fold hydrolase [Streptomyces sp. Je 1-79]MCT4357647.1 alpha/beta fold hydrolase [Streptomyces sp. Je 1-79]